MRYLTGGSASSTSESSSKETGIGFPAPASTLMDFVGQFSTQSRQKVQASSVALPGSATSMPSGHTVEQVRQPSFEMQVAQSA